MTASPRSSFSPSVARWLASELNIPPTLTTPAGNRGVRAMMALKRAADSGDGPLRADYVVHAQREMAGLDPARHSALLQHLQGCVVALGGRGGDTHLAHVTPDETVVSDPLMTPEIVELLQRAAREKGLDPARFVVGSGRNSINPNTGLMEFNDENQDQTQTCAFPAQFSGIGPNQATGIGALGVSPPDDSVAINPSVFGLPYDTIPERVASQREIMKYMPNIRVSAPGLSDLATGSTTFTVGDVGDSNIRNSPTPRFDIYRFETDDDANSFGKPTVQTTVSGIPSWWKCPKP